jgi:hypothetical protein
MTLTNLKRNFHNKIDPSPKNLRHGKKRPFSFSDLNAVENKKFKCDLQIIKTPKLSLCRFKKYTIVVYP